MSKKRWDLESARRTITSVGIKVTNFPATLEYPARKIVDIRNKLPGIKVLGAIDYLLHYEGFSLSSKKPVTPGLVEYLQERFRQFKARFKVTTQDLADRSKG